MKYQEQWDFLQTFLSAWPIERLRGMELVDYVKQGIHTTFANELEDRGGTLGKIGSQRGVRMYGICEPHEGTYKPTWEPHFIKPDNETYAWKRFLGTDKSLAFDIIKQQILKVIEIVQHGELNDIVSLDALDQCIRTKLSFIYQKDFNNIRVLPIYSDEKLYKYLGITDRSKTIYDMHAEIIKQHNLKTFDDAFDFMVRMFGSSQKWCDGIKYKSSKVPEPRKASEPRVVAGCEYQNIHSKIQNKLKKQLETQGWKADTESKHRHDNSQIDIVATKNNKLRYYEIKSYDKTIDTIREALGQLLEYWYYTKTDNYKKADALIIVGSTRATEFEYAFLEKLRKEHGIPVFYEQVEIEI